MRPLPGLALLSHLLWAQPVFAGTTESTCASACRECFQSVWFEPVDPAESRFEQSCRNRLALSSAYLCLRLNCAAEARDAALAALNASCEETFHAPIPPFSLVADYTADAIAHLRRIDKDASFGPHEPLDEVVLPSPDFLRVWNETLVSHMQRLIQPRPQTNRSQDAVAYVQRHHFLYGVAMTLFWGAVVAFGISNRLFQVSLRRRGSQPGLRLTSGGTWLKRNVILPATFGYRSSQSFSCFGTVPPRIQSLTILAYIVINIIFSVHGYRITEENFYFPTREKQILRHVSDRAGIISFACFPVIWLTGVRNNLAIWLTGWDYSTYSNFHRWVSRVAAIQAILHSIGYALLILREGGWSYYSWWFSQWFWNAGQFATLAMTALLPCSFYWIRRRHYETFLVLHVALSLLVLLFMLGHVSIFKGKYDGFFWVPIYIWVLDRLVRFLRIIAFNPKSWRINASAVYSNATNIIRLTIPLDKAAYRVAPGTYYYLTVLDDDRCWESHPFTVASVSSQSGKSGGEQVPLLEPEENLRGADDDGDATQLEPSTKNMTFLIRPYKGFTRRLRDLAATESPTRLRVLVDGPYGHSQRLDQYDHLLFIVGGSGVVTALSYLQSLTGAAQGSLKSIQLHWAVREAALARDALLNEIGDALSNSTVAFSVDLYMSSQAADLAMEQMPEVRLHSGRPDAGAVVRSAVARAGKHEALAVVACGPAKMADDSRFAAVHSLRAGSRIDYFEESFRW
ncbi:Uncharacterized protein TCAP_05704 [Tolypocladium capitatum]|uniref:FAD-binding FR-type domain-containing protein n=1 Tax=Tolypocladium capitatum TaxID=45235 RepID=A0A2K3Q9Z2_9HYPO|nr:Uncharacterized protein TCAP_05704 [Tolypocladium capitatum]